MKMRIQDAIGFAAAVATDLYVKASNLTDGHRRKAILTKADAISVLIEYVQNHPEKIEE